MLLEACLACHERGQITLFLHLLRLPAFQSFLLSAGGLACRPVHLVLRELTC